MRAPATLRRAPFPRYSSAVADLGEEGRDRVEVAGRMSLPEQPHEPLSGCEVEADDQRAPQDGGDPVARAGGRRTPCGRAGAARPRRGRSCRGPACCRSGGRASQWSRRPPRPARPPSRPGTGGYRRRRVHARQASPSATSRPGSTRACMHNAVMLRRKPLREGKCEMKLEFLYMPTRDLSAALGCTATGLAGRRRGARASPR